MSVLGYWKTRVLAQPIRLLLNYVGEQFEDVHYVLGDGPEFSKEAWLSVKHTLGLPFPDLPYYIDGEVKLTQSNAILRYIARKYDLLGRTTQEVADCEVMFENAVDLRNATTEVTYNPNYEKLKDKYFENLQPKLERFENFIGDKSWFAGNSISVCDFPIYELLDVHKVMFPGILDKFPNLTAFTVRFEALPTIKQYLSSDKFLARPINNKWAGFIGN
ncbi:glutathione S-transferase Mu 1-like isoform X1 [Mytilus trossulus]|uniref:glutathione S-transferase Mu 1-like isoform X1 n=1 Tax=Mytilus trossulus TaxID=6551 RepID=UPI0030077DA4